MPSEPRSIIAIVRFYQSFISAFQIIKELKYSDKVDLDVSNLSN